VERSQTCYKLNNFNNITWWTIEQTFSENTQLWSIAISWGHRLPIGTASGNTETYTFSSEEDATSDFNTRLNKQLQRRGFSRDIPTKVPDLPMLCQEYRNPPTWDSFAVQPKIDGIRCIVTEGQMTSRTSQLITSCPHIEMYLSSLPQEIKLDGELVIPNVPWVITEGYVNRHIPSKECLEIEYHVFDIIDTEAPFWARSQEVERIIKVLENKYLEFSYPTHAYFKSPHKSKKFPFRIVPTTIYDEPLDDEVVQKHFRASCDAGFEGLIVRNASASYQPAKRSSEILKLKQFFDKEYKIIDIIPDKRGEGKLVCELPSGTTFDCSFKATSAKRQQMLTYKHRYIGKLVTVEFEGIHESGRPRNPVGIKIHGL
jgi:ATP-dependent DNA ligase